MQLPELCLIENCARTVAPWKQRGCRCTLVWWRGPLELQRTLKRRTQHKLVVEIGVFGVLMAAGFSVFYVNVTHTYKTLPPVHLSAELASAARTKFRCPRPSLG
jgi:hypothetical protein